MNGATFHCEVLRGIEWFGLFVGNWNDCSITGACRTRLDRLLSGFDQPMHAAARPLVPERRAAPGSFSFTDRTPR
jgi:hypothetical protein